MKTSWKTTVLCASAAFFFAVPALSEPVMAKAPQTANQAPAFTGEDVGFNTQDPYFLNSDSLNMLYDQVNQTGAKWVRATLFWDLMQPKKNGPINWSQADMIFNSIKSHHLHYDMVLRSAPSWAAGGANTSLHNVAPTDAAAFESFAYQVAKRYLNRGVSISFELGNEENMQFFSMPNPSPYVYTKDMLIPGSIGIRKAAKELGVASPTILVGGFAPVSPQYVPHSVTPVYFMNGIYKYGGKGYFTNVAYHTYTYVSAPDPTNWTFTELTALVNILRAHGLGHSKIWATEVGWATGSGNGEISLSDQAQFTGEEFKYWFSLPYAGPMIWYELVDNQSYDNSNRENTFGLMYNSTYPYPPKPAYKVFVDAIKKADQQANHK